MGIPGDKHQGSRIQFFSDSYGRKYTSALIRAEMHFLNKCPDHLHLLHFSLHLRGHKLILFGIKLSSEELPELIYCTPSANANSVCRIRLEIIGSKSRKKWCESCALNAKCFTLQLCPYWQGFTLLASINRL